MARAKNGSNGRPEESISALSQAQANLVQAQAHLVQVQAACQIQIAESNRHIAEIQRQIAETDRINSERFRRIESILLEHTRILQALPEAVREKMGFKAPPAPK